MAEEIPQTAEEAIGHLQSDTAAAVKNAIKETSQTSSPQAVEQIRANLVKVVGMD